MEENETHNNKTTGLTRFSGSEVYSCDSTLDFLSFAFMPRFGKNAAAHKEFFNGRHRFEHWYRDNSIYFITARCRDRYPAFTTEEAKAIYWERFDFYSHQYQFIPIIGSLLDNHYHQMGYLREGKNLGPMMQRIHGSVAKMVNDLLPKRLLPFWRDAQHHDYFDGCIRDVLQMRRAYAYIRRQGVRHGACARGQFYRHTRVGVQLEPALRRAVELGAFLSEVPYARYEQEGRAKDRPTR